MKRIARVALAWIVAAGALLPLAGCRNANAEQTARTAEAFEALDFAQCAFFSECELLQPRMYGETKYVRSEKISVEGAYDAREGEDFFLDRLVAIEYSDAAEGAEVEPTNHYEALFFRGETKYSDSGQSTEALTLATCADFFRPAYPEDKSHSLLRTKNAATDVDFALEKAIPGHEALFAAKTEVYREEGGFRLEKTVPFADTVKASTASAFENGDWRAGIEKDLRGNVTLTAQFDADYRFLSCTAEYSATEKSAAVNADPATAATLSIRIRLVPGEGEAQSLSGCNARRAIFKEGDHEEKEFQRKINGSQIGGNLMTGYIWNFTFRCEATDKETMSVSIIKGKNEHGDLGGDYRETQTFTLDELETESAKGNGSIYTTFVVSFEFPVNRDMFQMSSRLRVSVTTTPGVYRAELSEYGLICRIETAYEYSVVE